jgi:hypothetical protein
MKPICFLKSDAVLKYTVGPGETAYRQCETDEPGAFAVMEIPNELCAEAYWRRVYGDFREKASGRELSWPEDVSGRSENLFRDGMRSALDKLFGIPDWPLEERDPAPAPAVEETGDRLVQFLYRLMRDHPEISFGEHLEETQDAKAVYSLPDIEDRAKAFADVLTRSYAVKQQQALEDLYRRQWASIISHSLAEFDLQTSVESTAEKQGRRSAIRGLMVRLGHYVDFTQELAKRENRKAKS